MIKILKFPILITLFLLSPFFYAEGNHKLFNLGDFDLESGITLPNAKLSYVTHGKLNEERDNLIVVPSAYLGDHHGFDFLIEPGKALDPQKYFIVATDMFQNGLSSSPSNTEPPFNGPNFPLISIRDNVKAGYKLVTEIFKVKKITKTPIVAIGGINDTNYKKLLLNNVNFLAISGYIWNNKKLKPIKAMKELK